MVNGDAELTVQCSVTVQADGSMSVCAFFSFLFLVHFPTVVDKGDSPPTVLRDLQVGGRLVTVGPVVTMEQSTITLSTSTSVLEVGAGLSLGGPLQILEPGGNATFTSFSSRPLTSEFRVSSASSSLPSLCCVCMCVRFSRCLWASFVPCHFQTLLSLRCADRDHWVHNFFRNSEFLRRHFCVWGSGGSGLKQCAFCCIGVGSPVYGVRSNIVHLHSEQSSTGNFWRALGYGGWLSIGVEWRNFSVFRSGNCPGAKLSLLIVAVKQLRACP